MMVIETGDLLPFSGTHTFEPYESLVVIDTHAERTEKHTAPTSKKLSLLGEWTVESFTHNSLTLDKCDYYFDGELVEKNGYVLNILPRINELERAVDLKQVYRFTVDHIPSQFFLATETPEIFEIFVNGVKIDKTDLGYFRDSAFRKLDIAPCVRTGENEIVFTSTIQQTPACYEHISKSWTFESMKNCLSYDMEIEPIYLVGDFGLRFVDEPKENADGSYVIDEVPVIAEKPEKVDIARLGYEGFAEFAGELTISKKIDVTDTDLYVYLKGEAMNAIRLKINGKDVITKLYAPYRVELNGYLNEGENTLELTLVNNLRNMMGPHHVFKEEDRWVCPGIFFKESNIFYHPEGAGADCHDVNSFYNDSYLLMKYGINE
jgi:hypothetical protein